MAENEGGRGTGRQQGGWWRRPRARGGRRLSAPTPRTGDGRRQPGQMKEGTTARASERAELHRYRMFEKTATQTDRRMEEGEGREKGLNVWRLWSRGRRKTVGGTKKLSPAADCRPCASFGRSLESTESCRAASNPPSVGRIVGVECSMYTSRQLGNLGSGPARPPARGRRKGRRKSPVGMEDTFSKTREAERGEEESGDERGRFVIS